MKALMVTGGGREDVVLGCWQVSPAVLAVMFATGCLLASPRSALADSTAAEAESLIREGVALRRAQHDVQALPLFQKAYDLVRNPRTAGQLGLCELSLGYWIEAEQHLNEALAIPGNPWVEKNRASLDSSLKHARDNIGEIAITGAPVGAEVYVNSRTVGRLPLQKPLRLARGVVDVELRAPGYVTSRRSLNVAAETTTLDMRLESERTPIVNVSPHPEPQPPERLREIPGGKPAVARANPDDQSDAHSSGRALRWVATSAAVLGTAALVGAGVETVRWQMGISDFDSHRVNGTPDCQVGAPLKGGSDCQNIYNRLTLDKQLAIIGFAAGGALIATSLTLFLVSPRTTSASDKISFVCAPTVLASGVACRLLF